ncbi:hypothetical protein ACQP2K_27905 [Microbispora siamensis]
MPSDAGYDPLRFADADMPMAELVLALALTEPTGLRNIQLAAMMWPGPDTPKPLLGRKWHRQLSEQLLDGRG